MNILITGGTGFIGTALRDHLLRQGHYLTIISRSPDRYESETAENQAFISWESDLAAAMNRADVVVNLVGENIFGKLWTDRVKERLYASRVENTRRLVEAVEQSDDRPDLFVSASGINYYGDRGSDLLDEEEPPGDSFMSRLCVDWETAAEPVKGVGVRLVVFRFGVVLEKGGGALQYMLPLFRFGLGGSIGPGTQYFPWVHMFDLCRAIDFAMEHDGLEGPCNLSSPDTVTIDEFADTLGEVLHRPTLFKAPEFAVKLLLGDASEPLLQSLRTQPKKLQQAGFEFRFEQLDEALSEII
ncbi:MAG: TIGR01777 family oxidoreductase [Balneolaceae bacterium]|nr:TIGR01777 family oxidoreductase [Balneolaceae bacterium]